MKDIWLPIITPLKDGSIDIPSYKGLIDHYISQNISGLIPMGTTGESPAFDAYEKELLLNVTLEQVDGRVPVFFGLGGNYTDKVVRQLRQLENSGIDGILSVCPYYNRPSQEGIYRHFESIAGSTDLDVLLYNIPYRTGRNIENDTLLRLGEIPNVIGVKDACGDFAQTTRLLMDKPSDFSVLSGDDATLFSALALGAEGAVSASAHLMTQGFVDLFSAFQEMDLMEAKKIWKDLYPVIPYLFMEPNPAPIKYLLSSSGLIASEELRLPLTSCSSSCKAALDAIMASYSLI